LRSVQSKAFLMLRAACALVLAVVCWAILGYLLTAPLGAFYGWSGHPSIPGAPTEVYIVLYLVVLPTLCLAGAWKVIAILGRALASKRKAS
jgi:hypothetical protein